MSGLKGRPWAGGIKRNKSSLPKGRSGIYGGITDPQPATKYRADGRANSARKLISASRTRWHAHYAPARRVRQQPTRRWAHAATLTASPAAARCIAHQSMLALSMTAASVRILLSRPGPERPILKRRDAW